MHFPRRHAEGWFHGGSKTILARPWTVVLAMGALLLGVNALGAEPGLAPLERLAGVYKYRFTNGDVSGQSFVSENILEVVPVAPDAAYFRVHLEFFNGHICALWGVAHLEGEALIFETPVEYSDPPSVCRVEISADGGGVTLREPTFEHHCSYYCGARGSMSAEWPYSSRSAIRYLKRLRASPQYAEALRAYQRDGARISPR
jgi:hypothetical protein